MPKKSKLLMCVRSLDSLGTGICNMQVRSMLVIIICGTMYQMPSTTTTLDAMCYSYGEPFAFSTEVVAAGTVNGIVEEAAGGIFVRSE